MIERELDAMPNVDSAARTVIVAAAIPEDEAFMLDAAVSRLGGGRRHPLMNRSVFIREAIRRKVSDVLKAA